MRRADELNLQAMVPRQSLGILPDFLAQRLDEACIVEQADAVATQIAGHALGVAHPGQRAHDDEAVVAREHARDLRGVAVGQQGHGSTLLSARDGLSKRSAMLKHTPVSVSALPS
jgi:hypothetical protein